MALVTTLAWCLLGPPSASAAPGDLDPTFSGDGLVTTDFGFGGTEFYAAQSATQADGKVVVAGTSDQSAESSDFSLARLNSDGTVDPTFGPGGNPTVDFGAGERAHDIKIQPDGKIVVVGHQFSRSTLAASTVVARFLPDGTLDPGFSGDGKLLDTAGSGAFAVALQPDGKILLAADGLVRLDSSGSLDTSFSGDGRLTTAIGAVDVKLQADGRVVVVGGSDDFAIARYTADGTVDTSFSTDGVDRVDFGFDDSANGVAIDSAGKIIVAGGAGATTGNQFGDFGVLRYTTTGVLDPSFSGDGKARADFGGDDDAAADVTLQSDGKAVVVGSGSGSNAPNTEGLAVARFGTDGALDAGFSGDGLAIMPGSGAYGVALASDGKVVVTGQGPSSGWDAGFGFEVIRYTSSGTLDPTFAGDGIQVIGFSRDEGATALARQADGKLVAVGSSSGAGTSLGDLAVVRYNADGSLDPTFSGDGRLTTDLGRASDDVAVDVAIQADGKIVVAGSSDDPFVDADADFALVRYNPDGSLDTSFSGDGRQTTDLGGNDGASGLTIQPDGRIVVVGGQASACGGNGCSYAWALARYSDAGSLDPTFSDDGKQVILTDSDTATAADVGLQSDGKIVAAGDNLVRRFAADGSLDVTFAGDGTSELGFEAGTGALAVQGDGRIVVVGGAGGDFSITRLTPDGSLDNGFSHDGGQTTATGGSGATGVAVQPDGKLVVSGSGGGAGQGDDTDFAVTRYGPDGTLDSTFSGDGIRTTNVGINDVAADLVVGSDGKITLVGRSGSDRDTSGTGSDFALARYESASGPPDTTPPDTAVASGPMGLTSARTPTFTFSSTEPGSTFECKVDAAAFASCSSPHTTAQLADGQHTFQVRATDAAGNADQTPASRAFAIDATPPETTVDSGPSGTVATAAQTLAFSSTEPGSTFECRVDAAAFAACASPLTTAPLGEGAHTFQVRATDAAGNPDATPASRSFTVGPPAPPPPDGDGDGVPDASDRCPLLAGALAAGGCPTPSPTMPVGPVSPVAPAAGPPSNAFSFVGRALGRRLTTLTLSVPGPGLLRAAQATAATPLVRPATAATRGAGKVTLKIRPSPAGKRLLRKRRSFSVTLRVTYTPTGGTPRSATRRVTVRR